ncbi:hypothetical protein [Fibrivirga algicola]|uniref:hypothetical protein n=1 Tax=Fibrivirga algicola TaxID=2950420 RepID=UPI001AAE8120|nr:hypothetical protein [Fibrivirga algicola]
MIRINTLFHLFTGALLVMLAGTGCVWAQQTTDSTKAETPSSSTTAVVARELPIDSLITPYGLMLADSAERARDSVRYSRLKQRMSKGKLTRELYNVLFRDVYNIRSSGEVNQIEVNPYKVYEGRVIGTIFIKRLGVFGSSVYDTTRNSANWVEKVANSLHVNTRENVIRRSYLQFQEGDLVNPTVLRDNERLLRNVGLFIDVRILVVPRLGSRQFVDVYVITQDVWSLLPDGGFSGFNNFQFGLDQRNFRGLGHQLFNRISYNATLPGQKTEYQGKYVIPYIGKTFLTGQADLVLLRDQKFISAKIYRPFLNPDTKWAGQLELGRYWLNNRVFDRRDSLLSFPLNYYYSDIWIGRSFPSPFRVRNPEDRARIVVAGRLTAYDYTRRPEVTADSNQLYQNRRTTIFSLGYSQRRYVRDVLIYGFGRTEDVPYGSLMSLVGGFEEAELGLRNYVGVSFSRGQYIHKIGYLYGLLNTGSYFRKGRREQSVLNLETNYFSPLHKIKWGQMRHFFNARVTVGADRFNNESINLNNNNSFGAGSDGLFGTKRLLVGYENLLFSRVNIAGFRVAFLTFANLGLVSYPERSLLAGPLYQGYGLGFRLRNENLTFNSLQIRFTYYPNLPNNASALRYAFEGVPVLRLRDFDINSPQVTVFQ